MASSTHQPVVEFYEWALKRYQSRSAALARALVVVSVGALLMGGLFFNQVRELTAQHQSTTARVERLAAELLEVRAAQRKGAASGGNVQAVPKRTTAYINCLEAQSKRYAEGMARLLRGNISSETFIKNYRPRNCG